MKKAAKITEAGEKYVTARETHYKTKDLGEALGLYRAIIDAHPETQEATYSRSQIQNIVKSVVPEQELFEAQVELALVHVAGDSSASSAPNPNAQRVADSQGEAT